MVDRARKFARLGREIAVDVARYWPRALITFLAGALVLVLLRQPIVEQSLLGQPDRQMLNTAFYLRTDVFVGDGDPALLIDIDNATIAGFQSHALSQGREPSPSASRGLIADLLRYTLAAPPGREPKAVILDVDLAAPTDDPAGEAKLHGVLADWAADPAAPTLIISRESFSPDLLGGEGSVRGLPTSAYDDIVSKAGNIYWAEAKILTDMYGQAVELLPYECVRNQGRVEPLFSAALLSYAVLEGGKVAPAAPVRKWMAEAADHCRKTPHLPILHGEAINYHISLARTDDHRVWPPLPKTWPGYAVCGRETDPAMFRRLSAGVIQQAGVDASPDILCRRLVVIGGTNSVANDYLSTPLGEMPGAMILINAARGLQISGGGLRQAPLSLQLLVLGVISVAITTSFTLSRRARLTYRERRGVARGWAREIVLLPLNPVVLNFTVALLAHGLGIGLMLVALHLGHWGFLSGPAFGSALAETIQDFTDEKI